MLNFQAHEEDHLLADIDRAIADAATAMDLGDLADDDTDDAEEQRELAYDARHHCGTCQVRTVMEIVWPAINNYITYLKGHRATEH